MADKKEKKMHWWYLLCGGFVIGIIALVFIETLWAITFKLVNYLGIIWLPHNLVKRCWGYW